MDVFALRKHNYIKEKNLRRACITQKCSAAVVAKLLNKRIK